MRVTTLKKAMLMLFLLTFIGQATASSLMAYKMMTMSSSYSMSTMDHHKMNVDMNHAMNQMNDDGVSSNMSHNDCCQTKCNCLDNGCAFTALTTDFYFQQPLVASTTKFYSPSLVHYNQQSNSLYRPPILS